MKANNTAVSKYDEFNVIRSLGNKHDINIPPGTRRIQILVGTTAKGDVGIKSRGKIDFLTNFCGFSREEVKKFY